ncbi:MAG: hypothetical protein SVR08_18595, partial [Spirochaetota bacterium]|nr:hypothetical protein [Spirochaetota bacterium]
YRLKIIRLIEPDSGNIFINNTNINRLSGKELRVFLLIGDIYFDRNQLEMTNKYYETSLNLKPRNGSGLLSMAKLHYMRKKYFKSIVQIKSIAPGSEYDISLHYYYAECACKLRDYKTANEEYNTLLKYRNDKFINKLRCS